VIKAKLVTEAEAARRSPHSTCRRDLRRKELELQGEGEGAKRRAIMQAMEPDGEAGSLQAVMHDAFEAVKAIKQLVPGVVMAGAGRMGTPATVRWT